MTSYKLPGQSTFAKPHAKITPTGDDGSMTWQARVMIGGILLTLALLCLGAIIFKGIPAFDNAKDGASESARLKYFANWRRSAAWAFVWTAAAWAFACGAAITLQEAGLEPAKYGAMIFGAFLFLSLIMIAVCYRSYRSLAARHVNTAAN